MAGSQVPGRFHPILLNFKRVWPLRNKPLHEDTCPINRSRWSGLLHILAESPVRRVGERGKVGRRANLMAAPGMAPYIHWMREHREIFEFVDRVGRYGSGWWADIAA